MSKTKWILIIGCVVPNFLFSSWFMEWFLQDNTERVDFDCPHECGKWGSESIQNIEWDFVNCLYDMYKLTEFYSENVLYFHENPSCKEAKPLFPKIDPPPENFQSKWYQSIQIGGKGGYFNPCLCFSNDLNEGLVWEIEEVKEVNGKHLGKKFIRLDTSRP